MRSTKIFKDLMEYQRLPLLKQLQQLNSEGTILCERYFFSRRVSLLYLRGFYVEVWYDTIREEVVKVLPFSSLQCLQPYLDLINIDDALRKAY
ncbi:hypothetical protein QNI19_32670 [Cytophagaceae bacterium DM2B3-1]|uniref:Uncharacterized protein n=2 Tax=Xanthocytophaga TaxID=3078918 RepID=A0AAE3QV93_9BACT|nr:MULTISPECIES: hypothetical protein [Xanthocytophaga]MDJ1473303.1 hypothetical protein [Xanthocytophaga flavus]MDJ1486087.1 hypothetical protein [Xanthocytophaga flavus]MDJ1497740.1 hypothetical protein [Xanthocytophaga flavus]MDJ1501151.1 hypothetical protein [Xanthocytophaga agilis]